MNDIKLKLAGLTCEACVKLVSNRFKKIPGVRDVDINLINGETKVSSETNIDLAILENSLAGTHYSIVK